MKIMLIQDVTQDVTQDDTPDIHPRELEAHRNEQKTNDQQKIGGTKNGNIRCIGHHAGAGRGAGRTGTHRQNETCVINFIV
jgi:hypothetical protein